MRKNGERLFISGLRMHGDVSAITDTRKLASAMDMEYGQKPSTGFNEQKQQTGHRGNLIFNRLTHK